MNFDINKLQKVADQIGQEKQHKEEMDRNISKEKVT